MKAVRELKSFLPEIYRQRKISRQDIHFIFGKIREILENKRNYQRTYPELNLFCNWCLHPELSASKTIFNALIRISKSITDALDKNMTEEEKVITTKNFISVSANILNIPKLRVGMKSVLESFYIDARITNEKAWWDACLQLLLQEVSEKPIKFPENIVSGEVKKGDAYNSFQKLMNISSDRDHDKVISLEIKVDEDAKQYMLHLKTLSGMTYILGMQGKEPDAAYL
jgi:hypothetical protein